MSHPVITGANGGPGPEGRWQNRLEIREFMKNGKQFSLYIQALQRLMKLDFANDLSFSSIGGIHGMPYVQWGKSGASTQPPDTDFGGYCTHGSVLFPTWHRPYVALFEQELYKHANEIASSYDDEWKAAAHNLRSPYWDWASVDSDKKIPKELTTPTIRIMTKDGDELVEVKNPLSGYDFHSDDPNKTFPDYLKSWGSTLRHPTSKDSNAGSNIGALQDEYAQDCEQIRIQMYYCLVTLKTWDTFSNHTTNRGSDDRASSLESVHDSVHVLIGGYDPRGHMAVTETAGFDPIFWLHHTNVDRMLALWSALNPSVWVTGGDQPDGTWTISNDGPVNVLTDLTPFWDSASSYWNSNAVRISESLRYTYPEFNDIKTSNPTEIMRIILRKVNSLYAPDYSVTVPKSASQAPLYEYTVRIKFRKLELGSSFSILVNLGETYVGRVSAFTSQQPERCANCVSNANKEIEGYVHLTPTIRRNYPSGGLDHGTVLQHLKADLSFDIRGTKKDGSPAQLADLTSFKAMPFFYSVTKGPLDELPTYGSNTPLPDILEGKPGHVSDPADF
ncbi:hypothetical protein CERSUDRAFT_116584 [Gelatoporia subvermispora B]|uniref:tyrosinase n=1 Tax=Ceriporiopsis subvermispora (strain B) TaxID=914234 RepID=M2R9G9_CERS8|nr:hypothetical protein CERSUDRAFT_116584 [Gelatoporia subvermispora B]